MKVMPPTKIRLVFGVDVQYRVIGQWFDFKPTDFVIVLAVFGDDFAFGYCHIIKDIGLVFFGVTNKVGGLYFF